MIKEMDVGMLCRAFEENSRRFQNAEDEIYVNPQNGTYMFFDVSEIKNGKYFHLHSSPIHHYANKGAHYALITDTLYTIIILALHGFIIILVI